MTFSNRLRDVQTAQRSLLCVGLDSDNRKIPPHLRSSVEGILEFNRGIVQATSDLVCAYKLNLAFYEVLGSRGWDILKATLAMIPKSVLTIGDGKRGDIGNTAEQYSAALFDELSFDAITVNPLMGHDAVEPFLRKPDRGVFLLTLTSNAGSRDFQRVKMGKSYLFERIALRARSWNDRDNIGLVVGATHPAELRRIRKIVLMMPILIPGIGTQGGDLKSAVRYGCNSERWGSIINASRSIIYASSEATFAESARAEAVKLRNEIEQHRLAVGAAGHRSRHIHGSGRGARRR
jgi:orotidine-5'-phosphate decarboxylase